LPSPGLSLCRARNRRARHCDQPGKPLPICVLCLKVQFQPESPPRYELSGHIGGEIADDWRSTRGDALTGQPGVHLVPCWLQHSSKGYSDLHANCHVGLLGTVDQSRFYDQTSFSLGDRFLIRSLPLGSGKNISNRQNHPNSHQAIANDPVFAKFETYSCESLSVAHSFKREPAPSARRRQNLPVQKE